MAIYYVGSLDSGMEWDGGIFEVEWWDWREVSLSNSVALSYQIQTIPLYGAVVGGKQKTREGQISG